MDDPRRIEARRLYTDPGMSLAQLKRHFGVGDATLKVWLRGIQPPEWTSRPNAKDELRTRARELRAHGSSVNDIAAQLSVSKSTAYLWTRDIPLDKTPAEAEARRSRHMEHMRESRWEPYRQTRDAERASVNAAGRERVGALSDREILLLGAATYWCEGAKAKQWAPHRCRVVYINSDPALILLFLRFVELMGRDRLALTYRLSIHESADVEAAGQWWADCVGVPTENFSRPTLKKHNPLTIRHNVGDSYRGCLVVGVPQSRQLYWDIEGLMSGIAVAAGWEQGATM